MIELKDVTKSYGSLTVLHEISLKIEEGEILSIVGPSGAGKTTLLQIAGTLDKPDSGTVRIDGTEPFRLKDKKLSQFRNSNIGFIFQFHRLLPEFSALENVAMPALIGGRKRKTAFEEAKKLLEELGLGNRLRHKPAELSGGERQRAAIARALINSPKVIFADEPTGSLDSHNRDEIKDIILNLNSSRNQTFVIVTHDPDMAGIASRTVTMADGRILSEFSEGKKSDMSQNLSIFADGNPSETIADEPDSNQRQTDIII